MSEQQEFVNTTDIRHGDVYLFKIDKLPEGSEKFIKSPKGGMVIKEGELTGHHHSMTAFSGGDVKNATILQNPTSKQMYLKIEGSQQVLEHQEHNPLHIPAQIYEIRDEKEYDELTEAMRNTAD